MMMIPKLAYYRRVSSPPALAGGVVRLSSTSSLANNNKNNKKSNHGNAKTSSTTRTNYNSNKFSTAAAIPNPIDHDENDYGASSSSSSSSDIGTGSLQYPRLFEPLHLGPDIGTLPNRVLMGSMHTGLEGHSVPRWAVPWLIGRHGGADHHLGEAHHLDRMAAYFEARAKGGVGLMVTGGIAPNWQGMTAPFSAKLTTHDEMVQHQVVTQAVHNIQVPIVVQPLQQQQEATRETGGGVTSNPAFPESVPARICLQILHTGRYGYHPWAVSASKTRSPISPFTARALSKREIEQTKNDFVRTAILAKQAGYDGVEIMASEGYLLSQFLSPRTNHRTDEYGGGDGLENRARLPLEIVQETRQAVGSDFIIIFRLSLLDLVDQGLSFEEAIQVAQQVQSSGATILNTGIGWHESRVPTIHTSVPRAAFAFPTQRLKELGVVNIPLVATNRINHPQTAETLLSDQYCDMISMARPFLADPDLLLKARNNRTDEINTCIGCNQACLDHAFVGQVASCLVNPMACHETELQPRLLPKEQRLRLGIVGAGPAGCAFALAARQMGHVVTLYDKDDKLGGQFNMAKRIPGKEEFYETLRYFERRLTQDDGVTLRFNTFMTAHDMEQQDANIDYWIDASGVEPRNPKIPGQDHPNVLTYIDVLKKQKPVGRRVAIIGAGGIGFDVGEYLLHHRPSSSSQTQVVKAEDVDPQMFWKNWGIDTSLERRGGLVSQDNNNNRGAKTMDNGTDDDDKNNNNKEEEEDAPRQIYLLQRKTTKLGKGLGKTTGWIHRAALNQPSVEMIAGAQYTKIDEQGHLHIKVTQKNKNNKTTTEDRVLDVDTIVLCSGQVEHTTLRDEASSNLKRKLYVIGGAYYAGELDAKRAIDMGTRLALELHEHAERNQDASTHIPAGSQPPPPGVEQALFTLLRRFM